MLERVPMLGHVGWILFFLGWGAPTFAAIPCPEAISLVVPPSFVNALDMDELNARANAAIESGDLAEALALAEQAVAHWKAEFARASAVNNRKGRQRAEEVLRKLRSSQMAVLTIVGLPVYPEKSRESYRKKMAKDLLLSGRLVAKQHGIEVRERKIFKFPALSLQEENGQALGFTEFITLARTLVPGEPYDVVYSPGLLNDGGSTLALILREERVLGIGHEAFTSLTPGWPEGHELTHLRLEGALVNGEASDFHGYDQALTQLLPGPQNGYSQRFSHNEPYNNQEDALVGIAAFNLALKNKDGLARDAAAEFLINSALRGNGNADRLGIIARGFARYYSQMILRAPQSRITIPMDATFSETGKSWFSTTVLQLDGGPHFGVYLQTRGNGRQIPWFVTYSEGRLFSIPLIDLSVNDAARMIADLGRIDRSLRTSGRVSAADQKYDFEIPRVAARLAAEEYGRQADTAVLMQPRFENLLMAGLAWMNDRDGKASTREFQKAMREFAKQTVPMTR